MHLLHPEFEGGCNEAGELTVPAASSTVIHGRMSHRILLGREKIDKRSTNKPNIKSTM
jgi:hypothetical protein